MIPDSRFRMSRIQGSRLRVKDPGFEAQSQGSRVTESRIQGHRVQGHRVQDPGSRSLGLGPDGYAKTGTDGYAKTGTDGYARTGPPGHDHPGYTLHQLALSYAATAPAYTKMSRGAHKRVSKSLELSLNENLDLDRSEN